MKAILQWLAIAAIVLLPSTAHAQRVEVPAYCAPLKSIERLNRETYRMRIVWTGEATDDGDLAMLATSSTGHWVFYIAFLKTETACVISMGDK